jgi:dipeptidase D
MSLLANLKPQRVFYYFEQISNIPRESGNEKAVSDYLVSVGKELGLETYQDSALNVVIKKKGSEDNENLSPVILQGHMDMVCTKLESLEFDFNKDSLPIFIDGDVIRTKGTTLGADNGIAVAMSLAILEDKTLVHPPLEVLVTTEEETGMGGASKLDKSLLKGKTLLNLDSEEEGIFLTSCAGGVRSIVTLDVSYTDNKFTNAYEIKVNDLSGGHSGIEIHKERANGIKLLGRMLQNIPADFSLSSIEGGEKMNAIAKRAKVIVLTNAPLERFVEEFESIFKNEFKNIDKELNLSIKKVQKPEIMFTEDTVFSIVALLRLIPQGVNTMSTDIEGLVESSTNLGVLTYVNDKVTFESATRSSVPSLKNEITSRIKMVADMSGASFELQSDYPAWEYNPNSPIRELMLSTYEKMTGKKASVTAIHAGLECGILSEKLGDLDMVSFGPNMGDVHTPNEHLYISSVEKTYKFLIEVLENIK